MMGDPHNVARYGEIWEQRRIGAYLRDMEKLKPYVVLSGGWAWHFLSPKGHVEYKHCHDHKDLDILVPSVRVNRVMGLIYELNYKKVSTKYDRFPSDEDFRRYERTVEDGSEHPFKLTIDFFVYSDPSTLTTPEGWKVVHPEELLKLYGTIHSSDKCWAVRSAKKLLENGETPENLMGNQYLMLCPDLDMYFCTKCGWSGQFLGYNPDLGPLPNISDLCGGCLKYVAHNQGKPLYKTKADSVEGVRQVLEDLGRGA